MWMLFPFGKQEINEVVPIHETTKTESKLRQIYKHKAIFFPLYYAAYLSVLYIHRKLTSIYICLIVRKTFSPLSQYNLMETIYTYVQYRILFLFLYLSQQSKSIRYTSYRIVIKLTSVNAVTSTRTRTLLMHLHLPMYFLSYISSQLVITSLSVELPIVSLPLNYQILLFRTNLGLQKNKMESIESFHILSFPLNTISSIIHMQHWCSTSFTIYELILIHYFHPESEFNIGVHSLVFCILWV